MGKSGIPFPPPLGCCATQGGELPSNPNCRRRKFRPPSITTAVNFRQKLGEMLGQVRVDALAARIEAGFADVPEAEGLAEIEAAVAEARSSAKSG